MSAMDPTRFRVRPDQHVTLRGWDPADTRPFKNKRKAQGRLERGIERLVALQELLFAQDRWSVLLIFQAMDAAGKDSAIKHVMSGVNPQGTQVLVQARRRTRSSITISCGAARRRCPSAAASASSTARTTKSCSWSASIPRFWRSRSCRDARHAAYLEERFEDINAFERYLARNGTLILKFFLHVPRRSSGGACWSGSTSREELEVRGRRISRTRAVGRLPPGLRSRCCRRRARSHAPWFVVPADHNGSRRRGHRGPGRGRAREPRTRVSQARRRQQARGARSRRASELETQLMQQCADDIRRDGPVAQWRPAASRTCVAGVVVARCARAAALVPWLAGVRGERGRADSRCRDVSAPRRVRAGRDLPGRGRRRARRRRRHSRRHLRVDEAGRARRLAPEIRGRAASARGDARRHRSVHRQAARLSDQDWHLQLFEQRLARCCRFQRTIAPRSAARSSGCRGPAAARRSARRCATARPDLYRAGVFRKYLLVVTDGENTSGPQPGRCRARNLSEERRGREIYFVAFDTSAEKFAFLKEVGGDVIGAGSGGELRRRSTRSTRARSWPKPGAANATNSNRIGPKRLR